MHELTKHLFSVLRYARLQDQSDCRRSSVNSDGRAALLIPTYELHTSNTISCCDQILLIEPQAANGDSTDLASMGFCVVVPTRLFLSFPLNVLSACSNVF